MSTVAAKRGNSYVPPSCGSLEIPSTILDSELEAIRKRREALDCNTSAEATAETKSALSTDEQGIRDKLVGIALSGGGIRSATFSLGVMQRLAAEGCLSHVDYLSTVSGGGYIGGSLTWLLSCSAGKLNKGQAFGTTACNFPYGVEDPQAVGVRAGQHNILKHLCLHGKYLTPGKGITATSLIAVVLRGILLNILVWLPLVVALIVVLLLACDGSANPSWDGIRTVTAERLRSGSGLSLMLYPAAVMGGIFLAVSMVYSLGTWKPLIKDPYPRRRRFEKVIRWPLCLGLLFFVLGTLPSVEGWLVGYAKQAGAASLLLGVGGGMASFVSSGGKGSGRVPLSVLAPLAATLFFYGLALMSYGLALLVFEVAWFKWLLFVSVAVSLVTGWFVNLNYISIHRYYRDRLMEAFMPHPMTDGTTAAAEDADKAKLSDMCSEHAPYHLVNTNVVLVDSDDARWRIRGGDAFLLSPRYCGSSATGWIETDSYMERDPLTLATAVAVSGAAANPNTGSAGSGLTRSRVLSLLMSLLNVRLGYWVPNPAKPKSRRGANHFRAACQELSSRGYAECSNLLQLSDGGHFENLGVYELVRRRVKLIICCDGGADPEFSFADLQVLARRIGSDFEARINFDDCNRLERIIPREPDPQQVLRRDPNTDAYPVGVKFAERGHIKGTITHKDGHTCTLILLKSTMIKKSGLLLKGYKGANPDFPDQSTADQFFDEEQFEAYRELGYEIANRMLMDTNVNFRALLNACI